MKKQATLLGIVLSVLLCFSFVGCTNEKIGEEEDPTKTQLYIGNYDGGIGTTWLYEAADRFEEKYKDVCFEPGTDKKGVQVHVDPDKNVYHGYNLINNLSSIDQQIIFTERAYYDEYLASGKILEVTDAVKKPLTEFGETGTIEDKIPADQKAYLQRDGKYYVVPFCKTFAGIQYNVDLWDQNGYWILSDGEFSTPGSTPAEEPRSNGPDGKAGTYDDGLPATYDEFFKLCDYICETGCVPFAWTGQYIQQYTGYFNWSLYADFEGAENMRPNFTFAGEVDDIVTGFEGGVPTLETAAITPETGYKLHSQLGRYYALSFVERLMQGNPAKKFQYYTNKSMGQTYSHTAAQEDFVKSFYEAKPIAMLIEGTWWENEADSAFASAVKTNGESASRQNRKFGMMPLPKATEDKVGEPFTVAEQYDSYIVLNANLKGKQDLIDLAYLFVEFVCSDAEMVKFTQSTGLPRALDYTMSEEELSALTYYERQVWDINTGAEIIYPYSAANIYRNNTRSLGFGYDWEATVSGRPYNTPCKAMAEDRITAQQYFLGHAITESAWRNLYSADF